MPDQGPDSDRDGRSESIRVIASAERRAAETAMARPIASRVVCPAPSSAPEASPSVACAYRRATMACAQGRRLMGTLAGRRPFRVLTRRYPLQRVIASASMVPNSCQWVVSLRVGLAAPHGGLQACKLPSSSLRVVLRGERRLHTRPRHFSVFRVIASAQTPPSSVASALPSYCQCSEVGGGDGEAFLGLVLLVVDEDQNLPRLAATLRRKAAVQSMVNIQGPWSTINGQISKNQHLPRLAAPHSQS